MFYFVVIIFWDFFTEYVIIAKLFIITIKGYCFGEKAILSLMVIGSQ